MIVVMGGIVGGMVVAMYLPMFKLINVGGRRSLMNLAPAPPVTRRDAPSRYSARPPG
jgi:hypothetical protein